MSLTLSRAGGRHPADLEALRALPLFRGLRGKALARLERDHRFAVAPAGAVIYPQGSFATELLIVVAGLVGAYREAAGEPTLRLAGLEPGAWLGELSLYQHQRLPLSYVADLRSTFVAVPSELFGLLVRSPSAPIHGALQERLGRQVLELGGALFPPPAAPRPRGSRRAVDALVDPGAGEDPLALHGRGGELQGLGDLGDR